MSQEPSAPSICVIVPVYGQLAYARRTLASLFAKSPWATAVVVDDASPDWNTDWLKGFDPAKIKVYRYPKNGGLTRSWNAGFQLAKAFNPQYIVAGNADILFTAGWWRALLAAMAQGYDLVGPISNAPGVTAPRKSQHVSTYVSDYRVTDDPAYLDQVAARAYSTYVTSARVVEAPINGFFMMAETATWRKYSYSPELIFPPLITRMPSGRKNRTPLMTGQEDFLCARIRAAGGRTAIVPGSFIWHYRSVSRGTKFVKGDWFRAKETG